MIRDVVFLTTPDLIARYWPDAAALLAPVVDQAARGEFNLDDLAQMVRTGRAFAGVMLQDGATALAMVFEFRHYPRKTVLNIIALGGADLAGCAVTFWPGFVEWCRESGADEIEACTAPAMTRVLRGLGFSHTYDIVRRPC